VVAGGISVAGLFPLCGFVVDEPPGVVGAAALVLFVMTWQVSLWPRVISWSDVTHVWAGQAAHYDAWQIWVSARDPERDVETPIWRRGSRASHRNRIVLSPHEFATVVALLDPRR
jgi:hypothetical protein